jgi:hypothetical protein
MAADEDIWTCIPGRANYDVSDQGRVRSWAKKGCKGGRLDQPHLMIPQSVGSGYLQVYLGKDAGFEYVHRLVLLAFVGPCPDGMECRHKDGDKRNNRLSNLMWVTPLENSADKYTHGTLRRYVLPPPPEPYLFTDPFIPIEAIDPRETWKVIAEAPGHEISSTGRVGSYWGKGRKWVGTSRVILKNKRHPTGHEFVILRGVGGKRITRSVHRLVLDAFSPQVDEAHECRHLNGQAADNRIANLRWGSHHENMLDRTHHGTDNRGIRCGSAKLNEDQVLEIWRRRRNGEGPSKLAAEFGVDPNTVVSIHRQRTWKHLTDQYKET